jgi:hypothetical protein
MAIFRKRDREKRRQWRAYHAAAVLAAKSLYYWDGDVDDAYAEYTTRMREFGVLPVSKENFTQEKMYKYA